MVYNDNGFDIDRNIRKNYYNKTFTKQIMILYSICMLYVRISHITYNLTTVRTIVARGVNVTSIEAEPLESDIKHEI